MDKVTAKYPGLRVQPGNARSWGGFREFIRIFMRAQFGRPSGFWGAIVGAVMANARSNQERVRWTIEQLELQPNDRVLEIGFGPGYAIAEACKLLPGGFIAGVDHSEVMVRQATKRNAEAVKIGKVDLKLGSASDLPVYDKPFDKIFTINSIHFWTDPIPSLKALRERLKPGGLIAVTLQPRSRGSSIETTKGIGSELKTNLEEAGFTNVRLEFKHAEPAPVACAIGTR
jgi:SAM-dependent methyltransferase